MSPAQLERAKKAASRLAIELSNMPSVVISAAGLPIKTHPMRTALDVLEEVLQEVERDLKVREGCWDKEPGNGH